MTMTTKFAKCGNSLAIRVPQRLVEDYGLREGMEVTFARSRDQFGVKPVKRKPITLQEIVDSIDPNDPHELLFDDTPIGKEIW